MDCVHSEMGSRRDSSISTNSLSTSPRSPSLLIPGTISLDHRHFFSSTSRINSPFCTLECSTCNSIVHSSRRMTSPSPMHLLSAKSLGQILLRSPSPSLPRSAPISRKNSALPGDNPTSSITLFNCFFVQDILDSSSSELSQEDLLDLVQRCCCNEPLERPDFSTLRQAVKKLNE